MSKELSIGCTVDVYNANTDANIIRNALLSQAPYSDTGFWVFERTINEVTELLYINAKNCYVVGIYKQVDSKDIPF